MKFRKLLFFTSLFLFSLSTVSCRKTASKKRIDINSHISYLELPQIYSLNEIEKYTNSFKSLETQYFNKLDSLVQNEDNYLWLKIDFIIPQELKNRDLAMFTAYLRSADELWINGNFSGSYGNLPPFEFGSGLQAHYYSFPENQLNQNGTNTIYIKVWCGSSGSISSHMFIGEQNDAFHEAEFHTFFSSRIFILFTGFIIVIAFIFAFSYYALKKEGEMYTYLVFSLLCLYTVHFLIPFFAVQTPWVSNHISSYLTFIKFFFAISAYTTVYFASSFISSYLGYRKFNRNTIIRLVVLIIFAFITLQIKKYKTFSSFIYLVPFYTVFQLSFAIIDIVKTFFNPEKRKSVYKLLIGFSPVILSVPADIIIRFGFNLQNIPYITAYGWQITIYIFLSYLLGDLCKAYRNNIYLNQSLKNFNQKLEDEVKQRTDDLTKTNSMLAEQINRTNADLMTATLVQQGFMPQKTKSFNGFEIAIEYDPLSSVSGDLYDYYFTGEKLDGLCIFDVSGHGTSAGLVTMLSKNIINQNFKTGRLNNQTVSEILTNINESIISAKSYTDRYLTGVLFDFDSPDDNDLVHATVANAGHPYPILYKHKTDSITELKYHDPGKQYGIIGLIDFQTSFPNVDFTMEPGDVLVCFTDGLTEAKNEFNRQFGTDNLKKIIQQYNFHNANKILEIINDSLHSYVEKTELQDDISIIVLKRTPAIN